METPLTEQSHNVSMQQDKHAVLPSRKEVYVNNIYRSEAFEVLQVDMSRSLREIR